MQFFRDLLESFSEFVLSLLRDYFSAVLLVFFHPISGPQKLAKSSHNEERKSLSAALFLYLTAIFYFGFLQRSEVAQIEQVLPAISGKPSAEIYTLAIVAALYCGLSMLCCHSIALVMQANSSNIRESFNKIEIWPSLRRRRIRLETNIFSKKNARLRAIPYAFSASLLFFFCSVIPLNFGFVQKHLFISVSFWNTWSEIPSDELGRWFFYVPGVAVLIVVWAILPWYPLARLIAFPSTLVHELKAKRFLVTVFIQTVLSISNMTIILLSISSFNALTQKSSTLGISVTRLECDIKTDGYVYAMLHYVNETDRAYYFHDGTFRLELGEFGEDSNNLINSESFVANVVNHEDQSWSDFEVIEPTSSGFLELVSSQSVYRYEDAENIKLDPTNCRVFAPSYDSASVGSAIKDAFGSVTDRRP